MSKQVFCRDCVHSRTGRYSSTLSCVHPVVVKKATTNLFTVELADSVPCHDERTNNSWFAPCGKHGRRYKSKY